MSSWEGLNKSCPICGGWGPQVGQLYPGDIEYHVMCRHCHCYTSGSFSQAEEVAKWNTGKVLSVDGAPAPSLSGR